MKKRFLSIILTLCITLTLFPMVAYADTAFPSNTNFVVDGNPVSVTAAYLINDINYLQLRAIAVMLNGTASQFDVVWDGQYAVIEPGKPYSGTITETRLQNTTDVRPSNTKFKMNGEVFDFSDARLIDGDTNYIQLREFAQKLSGTASRFNVYWDGEARQAVIQPGADYTGNAPQSGGTKPLELGGIPRTINFDDLLILEISNTYAYARLLGYDPGGAYVIDFVIVPEGAEVKCTKYIPLYPEWQTTQYLIAPLSSIYFEHGALQPTKTFFVEYDDWDRAELAQGGSIIVENGNEYLFDTSTGDKAITSRYGNVAATFYSVSVFVVPNEIAARVGGPAPKMYDATLLDYYVPYDAGLDPVMYVLDSSVTELPADGWYELLYDHVFYVVNLNIDAEGNAELGEAMPIYIENKGDNQVTLRFEDGRYLGMDQTAADGARVRAVESPYPWNMYFENTDGFFGNRYSLRPSENTGLALTAPGMVDEGTPLILSSQSNMDAPPNAEFSFYLIEEMHSNVNQDSPADQTDIRKGGDYAGGNPCHKR